MRLSPLYLPYISPVSPLYLPYISPISAGGRTRCTRSASSSLTLTLTLSLTLTLTLTRYSSDDGVIPFIPPSWGGCNATPATRRSATGANVSLSADGAELRLLAYSGRRQLRAAPQRFLFDVAATPSKPLDLARHFEQRYLQAPHLTLALA